MFFLTSGLGHSILEWLELEDETGAINWYRSLYACDQFILTIDFLGQRNLCLCKILVGMKRDVHVMVTLCDIDLTLFMCCSGWWQPGEGSFMLLSGSVQSCVIPRTPPHLRILVTVDQREPRQTKKWKRCHLLVVQHQHNSEVMNTLLEISSDDFRVCFAVFSSAGRPLQIRSNPCWKSSVVHLRSRWAVVVVTLEKSGKNPRNSHLLNQNRSTMVAGRIGI